MELVPLKQFSGLSYLNPLSLIDQYEYKTAVSFEYEKECLNIRDFTRESQFSDTSVSIELLNDIEQLEKLYVFVNPSDIRRFLWRNKFLIEILFEAPKKIIEIFGNDIILCLELHHDPEEEWNELFIVIKTNYSPEEAIELENKLFEEWFIKISEKVKGRLNFTEEPL